VNRTDDVYDLRKAIRQELMHEFPEVMRGPTDIDLPELTDNTQNLADALQGETGTKSKSITVVLTRDKKTSTVNLAGPKRFSTNSKISKTDGEHYFVERKQLKKKLESLLFPPLSSKMSFVLLVGPRASGKSSMVNDLTIPTGFSCVTFSFETFQSEQNIWKFIYNSVQKRFSNLGIMCDKIPWTTSDEFSNFVNVKTENHKILLVIDEMDVIIGSPWQDEFLTTFRSLRNEKKEDTNTKHTTTGSLRNWSI